MELKDGAELAAKVAVLLGGVWIAGDNLLKASTFVNQLREAVVTGRKDGNPLELSHRKVLRNDWLLTMLGAVWFPLINGAVLVTLGYVLVPRDQPELLILVMVLASAPILGAGLFITCGVGDWRLMKAKLEEVEQATAASPKALPLADPRSGRSTSIG